MERGGRKMLGIGPGEVGVSLGIIGIAVVYEIMKVLVVNPLVLANIGAAFAVLANLAGAVLGIALIGRSASGAAIKKPKVGAKAFLGTIVCEANLVFGVIQNIILSGKIREMGAVPAMYTSSIREIFFNSHVIFVSGLVAGACGFASSLGTGIVSSTSIVALANDPSIFSKVVTMQLIVSGVGPFGLVMSMMILQITLDMK
jgi:F0F1-type ATP synthase membrane subunit c/vacuolar-type H+-ATPase subunit K